MTVVVTLSVRLPVVETFTCRCLSEESVPQARIRHLEMAENAEGGDIVAAILAARSADCACDLPVCRATGRPDKGCNTGNHGSPFGDDTRRAQVLRAQLGTLVGGTACS